MCCGSLLFNYILFAVPLTISRSSLLTSRSIMERALLLLHLRGNMHHYPGIYIFANLVCCYPSIGFTSPVYIIKYVSVSLLYVLFYLSFPSMLMRFYVCRPCVLYSDKTVQNSAAVTDDLSKCSIKEVEKPPMDRTSGIPMARLPIQVPQGMQGKNYFILILGFYSIIFKICFYSR